MEGNSYIYKKEHYLYAHIMEDTSQTYNYTVTTHNN